MSCTRLLNGSFALLWSSQFFLWTLLGVAGFVSATLAQDPAAVTELPKIPDSFLPLMGVSALGYLAGKVARKPGPVVKQLDPPPPYSAATPPVNGIRIVGENLSPRAQVLVNGELIPAAGVTVGPSQSSAAEFVTELVVTPAATAAALNAAVARAPAVAPTAGTPTPPAVATPAVKVINPDGQSAEQ